jgi:hypothetical protein
VPKFSSHESVRCVFSLSVPENSRKHVMFGEVSDHSLGHLLSHNMRDGPAMAGHAASPRETAYMARLKEVILYSAHIHPKIAHGAGGIHPNV